MTEESTDRRNLGRWLVAAVAAVGLINGVYLIEQHIRTTVGDAVGGALCDAHGLLDCQSALDSQYAELFGIPIALLGASFYVAIVVLAIFDRDEVRESSDPFRPAAIALTTFGLGVVYSVFLAVISYVELGSLCPLCSILYAVNIVGFGVSILWAGRGPHRVMLAQVKQAGKFFNGWTGLFAFAMGVALIAGSAWTSAEIDRRIDTERADGPEIAEQEAPTVDPSEYRHPDAPAKGPENAPVHISKFSNFPCPHCGRLAAALDQLHDAQGDRVRIEYRYFPLPNQQHGHLTARAAYCAGEQGEFWAMHDRLFAHAPQHGPDAVRQYAGQIGVDEAQFQQCLESDRARERVDEDVAAGNDLDIRGTPVFFLNGQRFEGAVPFEQLEQLVLQELE